MSLTLHRVSPAAPAAALAITALLFVAGCSDPKPDSVSQAPPLVTFAPDATTPPGSHAPISGPAVGITDFAFVPATLTVPVSATVTWINHDAEPHTVVASDGSFHSPGMDTDATFTYTFTNVGSFDYICSIHPMMHGSVVVTK